MCNCIEKIETQLTEQMQKAFPGREVIEPVQLSPKFVYSSGGYPVHLNCVGRVVYGKGTRKFDTFVLFSYCPFCGEKIAYKKQK